MSKNEMSKSIQESINNYDFIENISEYLNKIYDCYNKKIIIIFDDLDRCLENKIIEILTVIKNILFINVSKNVFFISAININQINLILNYKNESYVDKIFEYKINIESLIELDSKEHEFNDIYKNIISIFHNKNWRELNNIIEKMYINYNINLENNLEIIDIENIVEFWLRLLELNNIDEFKITKKILIDFSIDESLKSVFSNLNKIINLDLFDSFFNNKNVYYLNLNNKLEYFDFKANYSGIVFYNDYRELFFYFTITSTNSYHPIKNMIPFLNFQNKIIFEENKSFQQSNKNYFYINYDKNKNLFIKPFVDFLGILSKKIELNLILMIDLDKIINNIIKL